MKYQPKDFYNKTYAWPVTHTSVKDARYRVSNKVTTKFVIKYSQGKAAMGNIPACEGCKFCFPHEVYDPVIDGYARCHCISKIYGRATAERREGHCGIEGLHFEKRAPWASKVIRLKCWWRRTDVTGAILASMLYFGLSLFATWIAVSVWNTVPETETPQVEEVYPDVTF